MATASPLSLSPWAFSIWNSLTWYMMVLLLVLFFYGVRLATYLLVRKLKRPAYVKTVSFDQVNNE